MRFSNVFNIDFYKMANLLTPPFLRTKTLIEWLIALLKPLEEINLRFNVARKDAIYKVTHNGQVFSLQAVLNDKYDNELRRIRIKDSLDVDPLYIYPENDNRPVYVYSESQNSDVYVYDDSVFEFIEFDFIVVIPIEYKPASAADLNNLTIQIKSLINYYKLASKKYLIEWT